MVYPDRFWTGTSIRSLLDAMKSILPERKFDVRFEPARVGGILPNYASIEEARRILGFDPKAQLNESLIGPEGSMPFFAPSLGSIECEASGRWHWRRFMCALGDGD